jgi:hypothetical protein
MATKPNQPAKPAAAAPAGNGKFGPGAVAGVNEGAKKEGGAVVLSNGERRSDYIRRRFAEGAKRGEIAKELGVVYQIVFAATKGKKEAAAAA